MAHVVAPGFKSAIHNALRDAREGKATMFKARKSQDRASLASVDSSQHASA